MISIVIIYDNYDFGRLARYVLKDMASISFVFDLQRNNANHNDNKRV